MKTKLFTLLLAIAASVGTMLAWDYEHVQIGDFYYNLDTLNLIAEVTPEVTNGYWSNNYRNFSIVNIPASVTYNDSTYNITSIGENAFRMEYFQYLKSVTIPNSVTNIGANAFKGCGGLTSITIPNSVTSIGEGAFAGCSNLPVINNIRYADTYLIEPVNKSLATYTIKKGTRFIGNNAFDGCTVLTSLTIPNSVINIGNKAFNDCTGLTTVAIPNSVTSIGTYAFYNCSNLNSLTIGSSVASIGRYAFTHCSSLTSVAIPNSVTNIGEWAFSYCTNLVSVQMSNSVTTIDATFAYCSNLTSITIPSSVTSVGSYAFTGCGSLTSVTILSNNIMNSNFIKTMFGSQIREYIIDGAVTSIRDHAFQDCTDLTSLTIGNSVTTIGRLACYNRTGLTSLKIGAGVENIGESAFRGCASLQYVSIDAVTPPTFDSYAFDNTGSCPVYVPCGVLEAYYAIHTSELWWLRFKNRLQNFGYKLAGSVNMEEAGDIVLPQTVCDEQIIAAIPNYGYHFTHWSDGNTDNPRTIVLTQDTTFMAEFAKNIYTIAKTANSEQGSISGVSQAEYLDNVTLTVNPNYGYHFTHWSDGNTNNPRTFVLTQDTTFTAEFAKNTYTISTTSANPEWGTTAGDTAALYLDEIEISAAANYGYHFVKWNDNNTSNPRTISVTEDKTFTATFAKNVYTITKNAEHGSISGNSSAEYLDEVTLTANPDYGYHFTQWSDGNKENPRTFVLTQNMTFTAEFAVDKSGTCGKNNLLQWRFADDGTLTISGSGELTENYTFGVEAPTQMQQLVIGNEVTSIGERAFYEKTTLQKLIIGSNVTSIGKYAFASINNRQLTSLVMPAELLTIGDYAFSGNTYVESIDFNVKLQSIGAYAFKDCYRVSEMTCLATVTPDLGTDALASINSYSSLCVPAECLRKYQVDPNWGRFDLCELGTTSTVTENRTVTIEPTDNTAIFTWPTENNAASYSLQITKDGVVFCTLVFNSNGQLTGIAFAPGRNGAAHAPAATMSVAGMSFTVTGLNVASKYAYRLAVADDASEELVAYSGEFATTGYDGEVNPGGNPEGIEDVFTDEHKASKILHNGQIFILRGDKTYTLQGQEVK